MKKILLVMFIFFTPWALYAANLCVNDDAFMVVLDPAISGTFTSFDTTSKEWVVTFPYGQVSGIAACSNVVPTDAAIGPISNDPAITPASNTGNYCYYKMLRPVESSWVSAGYDGSCNTRCFNKAYTLSSLFSVNGESLRRRLFGSVGM